MVADRGQAPFVGRRTELESLVSLLEAAGRRAPRVAMVSGEPGIGKTQLVRELEAAASDRGYAVAWGRCREDGGAPPLWPWSEALGSVGVSVDATWPAEQQSPDGATGQSNMSARFALFERIAGEVAAASERRPLVLVLDDLHRADEASLLLLRHLAGGRGGPQLVLIGAYRSSQVTEPLADVLGSLSGDTVHVRLQGLGYDAVRTLFETVTNTDTTAEERAELAVRTGGNPFYLLELARIVAHGGGSLLPDSLREAILKRVALLPEPVQQVLERASVVGRDFELDVLDTLGTEPVAVLAELLAVAQRAELVDEDGRGGYRFTHALVQETLYGRISVTRAAEWHELCVAALAPGALRSPEVLSDLAYHALCAHRAGRSVDVRRWVAAAAREALRRLAYEDAARHYESLAPLVDADELAAVLIDWARALQMAGQAEASRARFERAFALAEAARDVETMAAAALGVGTTVVNAGSVDWALVELLESAIAAAPGQARLQARLLARLALELYWHAESAASRETSQRAIEAGERADDPLALSEALFARMFTLRGPSRSPTERLAVAERIIGLAAEHRLHDVEFRARFFGAAERLQLGDTAGFRADVSALRRLADISNQPHERWYADLHGALLATLDGDVERARAAIEESGELGKRLGIPVAAAYRMGQLCALSRETTGLGEIADELVETCARFPYFATMRAMLALVHVETGEPDRAETEIVRLSAGRCSAIPPDSLWLCSVGFVGEVSAALGSDTERSRMLYELLSPHAGRNLVQGVPACWGSVDRVLGRLADQLGEHGRADAHFDAALARHRGWGLTFFVPRTLFDHGRSLWDRDRPRARALLDEARALAERHGLTALRRRIGEIDRGVAGLTARELEVIGLVARGATNQDIADRLFISVHTVERHLSNIYTKLGVRGRAEASAELIRAGLL